MIQTAFPEHPLLTRLIAEGYDGFARTALAERAAANGVTSRQPQRVVRARTLV